MNDKTVYLISNKIPSAIHVDNTARVQTVNKTQNNNFYNLINEFYRQTGTPVILNTSFNDAGEPLVETPLDALLCFLKTKIDFLVIENVIIDKKKQTSIKNKIYKLEKLRKNIIETNKKKSIKSISKDFSLKEFKTKKKFENLKAKRHVLDRPVDKINIFLDKINNQKKPLLIIGTPDHTSVLLKLFGKKLKNYCFLNLGKNDILDYKINLKNIHTIKNYNLKDFYKDIFISTFEYHNDVINKFHLKKNIFIPYDNSSRSILDFFYIKKFSDRSKLHSKILKL